MKLKIYLTLVFFMFACGMIVFSDLILIHFWLPQAIKEGATVTLLLQTFLFLLIVVITFTLAFYVFLKNLILE